MRRMSVSTDKWKNPGEYQEKLESVRVSKNFPGEYRKWGRICVSIEKLSRRVPEKGQICVRIENW